MVIIQLPPVDFIHTYITSRMSMGGAQMTPEQIQGLRAQHGADQPKPIQYLPWISLVARADFGFTWSTSDRSPRSSATGWR